MDLQLIIYIVFGLIYLIFSVLKKRQQAGGEPNAGPPPIFREEDSPSGGPFHKEPSSLEELLERYDQAARRAKGRAAEKTETMREQVDDEFIPVSGNKPMYRNLEAEAMEQMQQTERLKSLQEELPAKARVEVMKQDRPKSKSAGLNSKKSHLREKPKRRWHQARREPSMAENIRKLMSTRKGMKQAVVLSEVLNRKHF